MFVGGVPMIAADMVSFIAQRPGGIRHRHPGHHVGGTGSHFPAGSLGGDPLLTCSATVVIMLGLLGALDWRMTVISSNFVAVLLIITLAIAIHLIVRYRELHALEPDGDLHERVLRAVQLMAVPCIYTGITTIVAFVSLVVSGIQPVIDFGWMMTTGIVLAFLLTFLLVPCMILVWPTGQAPPAHRHRCATDRRICALYRPPWPQHPDGHPAAGGAHWRGYQPLQVENRFIDYFHKSTEIYQGMELLDSQLGGTIPLDIILSPLDLDKPLPGLEAPVGGRQRPR